MNPTQIRIWVTTEQKYIPKKIKNKLQKWIWALKFILILNPFSQNEFEYSKWVIGTILQPRITRHAITENRESDTEIDLRCWWWSLLSLFLVKGSLNVNPKSLTPMTWISKSSVTPYGKALLFQLCSFSEFETKWKSRNLTILNKITKVNSCYIFGLNKIIHRKNQTNEYGTSTYFNIQIVNRLGPKDSFEWFSQSVWSMSCLNSLL